MKRLPLAAALLALAAPVTADPGTAFTYQGRLESGGAPRDGAVSLRFGLFTDPSATSQVGASITRTDATANKGLVSEVLDFGQDVLDGSPLYLRIEVDGDGSANGESFTDLGVVQLLPVPYAVFAQSAEVAASAGAAALAAEALFAQEAAVAQAATVAGSVENEVQQLSFTSPMLSIDGTGGNSVDLSALQDGTGMDWGRTGNSGTVDGTNFIGTTDNVALDVRVNNRRVLRLQPGLSVPSIVGGHAGNTVAANANGSVIAGGGAALDEDSPSLGPNTVSSWFGFLGGGVRNEVSGDAGVICGGARNGASGLYSFIGSGQLNSASGEGSVVIGGVLNNASGLQATVAGGSSGIALGQYSTIAGGLQNSARGHYSAVLGGIGNAAGGISSVAMGDGAVVRDSAASGDFDGDEGTFVWADTSSTSDFTSTGPDQFLVRAAGGMGVNTNNPTAALEINAGSVDGLRIRNSSANPWAIRIKNASVASFETGMYVDSSGFFHVSNTLDAPWARLDSSGNWSVFSDARLKTGIEPMEGVLAKAMALKAIRYHYKDEAGEAKGEEQIGFTAQNVEAEFPSLVVTSEDVKTMNYSGLSTVAIAALQELKAEKDAEISALRSENDELRERLDRLEAMIGSR